MLLAHYLLRVCSMWRYLQMVILSLGFLSALGRAAAYGAVMPPEPARVRAIAGIGIESAETGTSVQIRMAGPISTYRSLIRANPLQIILDIDSPGIPFKEFSEAAQDPFLLRVRVGYHVEFIRVVLDLKGTAVPPFTIRADNEQLDIRLFSSLSSEKRENEPQDAPLVAAETESAEDTVAKDPTPLDTLPESPPEDAVVKDPTSPDALPESPPEADAVSPTLLSADPLLPDLMPAEEVILDKSAWQNRLIAPVTDDGADDSGYLLRALAAYRNQDWEAAQAQLTVLLQAYPAGRFAERGYFLLANVFAKLHANTSAADFMSIKGFYEDALNRYPQSEFVPEAMLGIGDLCFKNQNYREALGYYNYIIKHDTAPIFVVKALIQKTKLFIRSSEPRKGLESAKILWKQAAAMPNIPLHTEALKEIAKVLYENNSFQQSRDLLWSLEAADSQNVDLFPEIILYLGYNDYQLGDTGRAREYFIRFYNVCPDCEENHLILAQIGDTYRFEGAIRKAAKYYQFVTGRYPESEGALIAHIRLAELQEELKQTGKNGAETPAAIFGKSIRLPKEIYQQVLASPFSENSRNPLIQLALVKLAVIYSREHDDEQSFKALKALIGRYPWSDLEENIRHAVVKLVDSILQEKLRAGAYRKTIAIYQREKELLAQMNAPEIFLTMARAYRALKLEHRAIETYKLADGLMIDAEKPADLLFVLGREAITQEAFAKALTCLDLLTTHYPDDPQATEALRLKGEILLKQGEYAASAQVLAAALGHSQPPCERLSLLFDQAAALVESRPDVPPLATLTEIDTALAGCTPQRYENYQRLGELYRRLGDSQKALIFFKQGVELIDVPDERISLQLEIAHCYLGLGQKTEALEVYQRIADLNDPFWSALAQEKIDEINFKKEISPAESI